MAPDDPRRHAAAHLLWEACRTVPDPVAVRTAAERVVAEEVIGAAIAHRVAPLLWRALCAADSTAALAC